MSEHKQACSTAAKRMAMAAEVKALAERMGATVTISERRKDRDDSRSHCPWRISAQPPAFAFIQMDSSIGRIKRMILTSPWLSTIIHGSRLARKMTLSRRR